MMDRQCLCLRESERGHGWKGWVLVAGPASDEKNGAVGPEANMMTEGESRW